MNVVVCIKRVPATDTRIKIAEDGTSVETAGVEWIISPYDEFAVEAALQLRDAAGEGKVTIVSLGPKESTKELRTCLAMGADEAVLIVDDAHGDRPAETTAGALAAVISERSPDLVLCGKQAVDRDQGQVGLRLGVALGWPTLTEVRKLDVADGKATVERPGEDGTTERWQVTLPAVLTTTKGLNEPRYASLKGIMQAKKKPIDEVEPQFGASAMSLRSLTPPPPRREGRIVGEGADAVDELVRLLREEAKAI